MPYDSETIAEILAVADKIDTETGDDCDSHLYDMLVNCYPTMEAQCS